MNPLTPAVDKALDAFTVADLCHPTRLTEAVMNKLQQLPPGRFAHERLAHGIRLLLQIIRDAVCGGYPGLRLKALIDFLAALDYFLKWRDRRPDTWDGGYMDDLEEVLKVLAAHADIVMDYQEWSARRGEEVPQRWRTAHGPAYALVDEAVAVRHNKSGGPEIRTAAWGE